MARRWERQWWISWTRRCCTVYFAERLWTDSYKTASSVGVVTFNSCRVQLCSLGQHLQPVVESERFQPHQLFHCGTIIFAESYKVSILCYLTCVDMMGFCTLCAICSFPVPPFPPFLPFSCWLESFLNSCSSFSITSTDWSRLTVRLHAGLHLANAAS